MIRATASDATERQTFERALSDARSRAEGSERRLRALEQITTSCAASLRADTLAETVVATTARALESRGCAIWLVDGGGRRLSRAAVFGLPDRVAPRQIRAGAPLPAAHAWRLDETVVLGSPEEARAWFPGLATRLAEVGVAALVSLPLRVRGQVMGVLEIHLGQGRSSGTDDLALYGTIAAQVGQTLERARLLALLQRQALFDGLTRLPNRSLLRYRLQKAANDATATGAALAVLAIDIDGFKEVNDRLGHAAGDRVLVEIAERLQASVRAGDTVARLGGDEFVVVCEGADAAMAADLAARVTSALRLVVPTGGVPLILTASVGSAVFPASGTSPDLDGLLDRADRAMYEVKKLARRPRTRTRR